MSPEPSSQPAPQSQPQSPPASTDNEEILDAIVMTEPAPIGPPALPAVRNPEVLEELEKLQNRRANWTSVVLIFVVSAGLFVAAAKGASNWTWEFLLILIAVIFFHELGHYIAMRGFKYRNTRMLFIPFFGGAVIGRAFNVAGWKKVIVSLMGPVPGIIIGILLGLIGIGTDNDLLRKIALVAILLNAFNLLPVLPLDGGWVMHTLLFSRHHLLDVLFRLTAALALLGIAWAAGDRIMGALGIFMLIGVPVAWKMAKLATELRESGAIRPLVPNEQTIPPDIADNIVDHVRKSLPGKASNKTLAEHTLNVFETLTTHTPSWPATIGLGAVHVSALLLALVFGAVLFYAPHGRLNMPDLADSDSDTDSGDNDGGRGFGLGSLSSERLKNTVDPASIVTWTHPDPAPKLPSSATRKNDASPAGSATQPEAAPKRKTIIATFPNEMTASSAFIDATRRLPAGTSAAQFGRTLMIALPLNAEDELRRRWLAQIEMQARTRDVFVATGPSASLTITCQAPSVRAAGEIESEMGEYFESGISHLIPPWTPNDTRSPEKQAAHLNARRTYDRLAGAGSIDDKDPAFTKLYKQLREARRKADDLEIERLVKEQSELMKSRRKKAIEDLRASASQNDLDTVVIDRYLAVVGTDDDIFDDYDDEDEETVQAYEERYKRIQKEFGPLLGQVPVDAEGEPLPDTDRYIANGVVAHEGREMTVRMYHIPSPAHGPSSIVKWMAAKGCVDFRYEFISAYALEDEELDD
jgi:Zn-dependent protease